MATVPQRAHSAFSSKHFSTCKSLLEQMTFSETQAATVMDRNRFFTILSTPSPYFFILLIFILASTARLIFQKLYLYFHHQRLCRLHSCLPAPSYPHKDPLLGFDLALKTHKALRTQTYLSFSQSLYQAIGNTRSSISIGRKTLHTIDPANIKVILSTNFTDFTYGSPSSYRLRFRRLMGEGLMTTDGAAAKHSRALLQPTIKRVNQERDLKTFEHHFQRLLERIPKDRNEEVDLQPLFFAFTMETALDLFVGESRPPGFGNDAVDAFTAAFDRGLRTATVDFGLGWLTKWCSHAPLQLRRDRKLLERFIDFYVQDALARKTAPAAAAMTPNTEEKSIDWESSSSSRKSGSLFLDDLLLQTRDPKELRAELMFIMVAARDTTAGLLSSLWFILAQRPDIYAKLRAEILSVFPSGEKPDAARLERMPFLKSCINECTSSPLKFP